MQAVAKTRETDESPQRTNHAEERTRANLCAFIEQSGYTPTQVADLSGVPQANLSRYMLGKSAIPLDALTELARALGRDSIRDFTISDPPRQRNKAELARDLPLVAKARPGFEPTEEDIGELRIALERIARRHRGGKR